MSHAVRRLVATLVIILCAGMVDFFNFDTAHAEEVSTTEIGTTDPRDVGLRIREDPDYPGAVRIWLSPQVWDPAKNQSCQIEWGDDGQQTDRKSCPHLFAHSLAHTYQPGWYVLKVTVTENGVDYPLVHTISVGQGFSNEVASLQVPEVFYTSSTNSEEFLGADGTGRVFNFVSRYKVLENLESAFLTFSLEQQGVVTRTLSITSTDMISGQIFAWTQAVSDLSDGGQYVARFFVNGHEVERFTFYVSAGEVFSTRSKFLPVTLTGQNFEQSRPFSATVNVQNVRTGVRHQYQTGGQGIALPFGEYHIVFLTYLPSFSCQILTDVSGTACDENSGPYPWDAITRHLWSGQPNLLPVAPAAIVSNTLTLPVKNMAGYGEVSFSFKIEHNTSVALPEVVVSKTLTTTFVVPGQVLDVKIPNLGLLNQADSYQIFLYANGSVIQNVLFWVDGNQEARIGVRPLMQAGGRVEEIYSLKMTMLGHQNFAGVQSPVLQNVTAEDVVYKLRMEDQNLECLILAYKGVPIHVGPGQQSQFGLYMSRETDCLPAGVYNGRLWIDVFGSDETLIDQILFSVTAIVAPFEESREKIYLPLVMR